MTRQINHSRRSSLAMPGKQVGRLSRRAILALAAVSLLPLPTGAQRRMLLSHSYPRGSIVDEAAEIFARYAQETSGLQLEVIPEGSFMPSGGAFEALSAGKLDSWIGSAPAEAAMQSLQVFDVPFLIRNPEHFRRVVITGLEGPLARVFAERNLVLVAAIATGSHAISTSSRPVTRPSDLEGTKLTVRGGSITEEGLSGLGASTVRLPASEVFAASQAGFLDAFAGPIGSIDEQRLYEVQPYLSLTRHVYGVAYLVLSQEMAGEFEIESLRQIGREISEFSLTASQEADQETINALAEKGMKVIDVDPFEFEYTKKLTYDLYLSRAPEAWEMLNFVEDLAD